MSRLLHKAGGGYYGPTCFARKVSSFVAVFFPGQKVRFHGNFADASLNFCAVSERLRLSDNRAQTSLIVRNGYSETYWLEIGLRLKYKHIEECILTWGSCKVPRKTAETADFAQSRPFRGPRCGREIGWA